MKTGVALQERWHWCHDCDKALKPGGHLNGHAPHRTEPHPTQKPAKLARYCCARCCPTAYRATC